KLEVGDAVRAIGNPFGVGQTVTAGIVSAKGRGGMGIVDYEDFIQTDASINPGNSGGALVDAEGRLVGINTAILSRSGGNQGIGFAVPINLARYVMERILTDGKVSRGYLGVMIQPITPELAKEFKLPENTGALDGKEQTFTLKLGELPSEGMAKADRVEDTDAAPAPTRWMASSSKTSTPQRVASSTSPTTCAARWSWTWTRLRPPPQQVCARAM